MVIMVLRLARLRPGFSFFVYAVLKLNDEDCLVNILLWKKK